MQYIYQAPRGGKRSTPIDEANTFARGILEQAGWCVVETIGADVPESVTVSARADETPVVNVSAPKFEDLDDVDTTPLDTDADTPDDFLETIPFLFSHQRGHLRDAGYDTAEALDAATDEQLNALNSIGAATVKRIRDFLAGG